MTKGYRANTVRPVATASRDCPNTRTTRSGRYKGRGQFSQTWIAMNASQSRTYTSAKHIVVIDELCDSGKEPMGPLSRGRITAHTKAPGCGAPKIPAQQVIGPPAFTDRGRFCRRVFLLLLSGAVSC